MNGARKASGGGAPPHHEEMSFNKTEQNQERDYL